MLPGELNQAQIIGRLAGSGGDLVSVGRNALQASQYRSKRRCAFKIVIGDDEGRGFTKIDQGGLYMFGGFYFQVDSGSTIFGGFTQDGKLSFHRAREISMVLFETAGGENRGIRVVSKQMLKDGDTGEGVGQIVEAKFEKGAAIFVLPFGGAG